MSEMKDYLVEWSIDITADCPEAAAREALRIQRDSDSWATTFDVIPADGSGEAIQIDVQKLDDEEDLRRHGIPTHEANS